MTWAVDLPWTDWRPGTVARSGMPVTPDVHRNMALAIQRLWVHNMGSKRSMAFPAIIASPIARITAYDTATDFLMEDGADTYNPEFELPWFQQKGFDVITADVFVAHSLNVSNLNIRLQTQPLVSAVAATSGAYQRTPSPGQGHSHMINWSQQGSQSYQIMNYRCEVKPTLPADRRVALRVQCALPITGSDPIGLSFEHTVNIIGIRVKDTMVSVGNYEV